MNKSLGLLRFTFPRPAGWLYQCLAAFGGLTTGGVLISIAWYGLCLLLNNIPSLAYGSDGSPNFTAFAIASRIGIATVVLLLLMLSRWLARWSRAFAIGLAVASAVAAVLCYYLLPLGIVYVDTGLRGGGDDAGGGAGS